MPHIRRRLVPPDGVERSRHHRPCTARLALYGSSRLRRTNRWAVPVVSGERSWVPGGTVPRSADQRTTGTGSRRLRPDVLPLAQVDQQVPALLASHPPLSHQLDHQRGDGLELPAGAIGEARDLTWTRPRLAGASGSRRLD